MTPVELSTTIRLSAKSKEAIVGTRHSRSPTKNGIEVADVGVATSESMLR